MSGVPSVRLQAQAAAPAAVTPGATITSGGDFWSVSNEDRRKPQTVRMELTVLYYDPQWKLLWAESGGQGVYLPCRGESLAIRSGERVRLEGTVVPADGFAGELIKATVLDADAMPAPLSLAGRVGEVARFDARWVEGEGYVFVQSDPDPTHVLFVLLCENQVISLRMQINGTDPIPQLVGARIRFRGAYVATRDATGGIQQLDCWTSRRGDVELIDWLADDKRFKLPRTVVDDLEAAKQPWVRVVGKVRAQEMGKSLTVRDETGQITITTQQPEMLAENAAVEVIGRPVSTPAGWTLRDALFRTTGRAGQAVATLLGSGQAPLRLRLAEQVLKLPGDEAEKRYPVTLRGAVTWSDERADFFYLQDASGGVRVRYKPGQGSMLGAGSSLAFSGVTVRGPFVPEVELIEAAYLGTVAVPPVRSITLEQALSGAEEGQRVEMHGYVRQVLPESGWTRLDLTTLTGEFHAYLPEDKSLEDLQGALVRVRGVCNALVNANRELIDIRLWVQGRSAVSVDETPPTDPFSVSLQTIAGLRQFSSTQLTNRRVRLAGQVLLHEPGRYLYLQDETGGLFALTRGNERLHAGDRVEVVGFAGRAGNRVILREASWRSGGAGPAIKPQPLTEMNVPQAAVEAHLVEVQAVLRQVVTEGTQTKLIMQAGDVVFDAILHDVTGWVAPVTGSRLELTGVYVLEFDEYRQPRGFRLELRAATDVRVLALPPWWTARRTGYVFGGLLLVIALVASWSIVLRRRVKAQTEQIRLQLEKEARLQSELERSSRLESLGVLAGGIAHDFNNLLTAILGNLGLAALDKRAMEAAGDCIAEAERGARRAKDITQQLLTFAKGGDPVRKSVNLPDVVKESANFARHGSKVRFEFDYPPDLPPGDLDAGQISRVVHNLVINAVQAMPDGGVVSIALAAVKLAPSEVDMLPAGTYLRLTISDTGQGIPPDHLPKIFDPYFSTKDKAGNSGLGLAAVRSIVKKHQGHIDVESKVGRGTTFRVWLPATAQQQVPRVATAAPWTTRGPGPARVLVMDDEDVIRRVAGRMLSLAGHEAVFASDGAEAVKTYTALRASDHPFDLVIFDLTVPGGMGGKDALQELLKADPSIRAIASSGYSNDPVMANPRTYGFCTTLPKPYDVPDLLKAIEEARRT
ncbi:MAG TPA: ATP-binding protein [Lacunisphaera sp.]|nr:ATP-binding protein [Lacunisphaera sp.]